MEIRAFRPGDEAAVVQLWQECGLTRPWNDPHADIARKSSEQPELFLVGEIGSELMATAMVGFDGHRGWVYYLAVAPAHRRRSHGKALMQEAERLLVQRGCPKLNLLVRSSNAGVIEFYRRLGYAQDDAVALGKRLIHDQAPATATGRAGESVRTEPGGRVDGEAPNPREALEALKTELERFGAANDAATDERPRRMLNITRDTGEFLAVLVRASAARRVLEIGTSNGYSTLWLAGAARAIGGAVTTVESAEYKIGLASANFARSGLSACITLVHEDADRLLRRSDAGAYDLIFLDSERPAYPGWWPQLRRVLRPGGLLIVDNATSHAEQMAPFVALVTADTGFSTCLVPVGNGEFLALKTAA